MDMIGRLDETLYLQGTGSSPVWAREIERRNVPLGLAIVTSADSYLATDATPLYLKGVPILNAFTGPHTDYSTPRDTADKINYAGGEKVARLMAGIALSLARAEDAPAYVRQERPKDSIGRRHIRIYLGTIPDYAQGETKGVKLSGTTKGGPAEKAGVQPGDVIIRLGETEIGNIYDYVNTLGALKPDTPVDLVVQRNGAEVTLTIVPAAKE
jgi:C-terminal processing protease CtpA/Prc